MLAAHTAALSMNVAALHAPASSRQVCLKYGAVLPVNGESNDGPCLFMMTMIDVGANDWRKFAAVHYTSSPWFARCQPWVIVLYLSAALCHTHRIRAYVPSVPKAWLTGCCLRLATVLPMDATVLHLGAALWPCNHHKS